MNKHTDKQKIEEKNESNISKVLEKISLIHLINNSQDVTSVGEIQRSFLFSFG